MRKNKQLVDQIETVKREHKPHTKKTIEKNTWNLR